MRGPTGLSLAASLEGQNDKKGLMTWEHSHGGLKAINDAALGTTALTLFASWHTAAPGATGASEYTAVGITRVASGTLTSSNDTDSADLTNAAAITSPAATGATSAITHVGLWTALTGGVFVGIACTHDCCDAGAWREDQDTCRRSGHLIPDRVVRAAF